MNRIIKLIAKKPPKKKVLFVEEPRRYMVNGFQVSTEFSRFLSITFIHALSKQQNAFVT